MDELLRFTVLGPVRARRGSVEVPLGAPQQRVVLAVLLVRQGSLVPVEELVDAVWGEDVPASATSSVRTYVHRLRRVLEEGVESGSVISSVGRGYLMNAGADELDLAAFRQLVADADQARRDRDPERSVVLLREALALWPGSALGGIPGAWAQAQRTHLDRLRLAAVEARLTSELDLGGHQEAAPELTALVAEHPLDERFREMLMLALYRSGRQAAALEVYRRGQSLLADELGVDPGPALRTLHERILRADDTLLLPEPTTRAAEEPVAVPQAAPTAVPAQLPHDLRAFTGREGEMAQLAELLPPPGEDDSRAYGIVSVVAGTAGVGKTAFAVHCAHRIADRFPDGQIYLNLRGFDAPGLPVTPTLALCAALEGLGVPGDKLPQEVDALAAMYRSLLAGRRVLVLLDNARDTAQVRPLLPGAPGCMTIVTSRNQLSGLIVKDGAHHVRLDVLSPAEAREALARRIGDARVSAESDAAVEIVERSARLPLALALVAARAATRPGFPLAAIAEELRDSSGQLDAFGDDDGTVDARSVFSWSYHALTPAAARLFRLLGAHPGPDLTVPAAMSLAGLDATQARRLLSELSRAHLVDEHRPGRYAPHDLLRLYATELLAAHNSEEQRREATHRALTHYLHTGYAASRNLNPIWPVLSLTPPAPGAVPEDIADHEQALTWYQAESQVLQAGIEQAARTAGFERHAWQLAWVFLEFLQRRGHWDQQISTQSTALEAASRAGDREGAAHAHRNLARAQLQTHQTDEALAHLQQALILFEGLGDLAGQGSVHGNIAMARTGQGEVRKGLHHAQLSVGLFRKAGVPALYARAMNNLGWTHASLGEYEQALHHCLEALGVVQRLGDRMAEAGTCSSIGYVHHQLRDYHRAVDFYRRALRLDREISDRYNEADTLSHLGDTLLALGDREAARESWGSSLPAFDDLDPDAAKAVRAKLEGLDNGATP
ncbi:AfsR/SARP family transcriptional regulator [Streptomyces sp. NPDC020681]|uniref:AfsR/SARP family transcriptional regulator n=1 Tax=Streptomyces sp. NPDC020681 TaxID=3365083 RepID=UPI00378BE6C9